MYYDRLKKRVRDTVKARKAALVTHTDITDCIAPCYLPMHEDVSAGAHTIYHLPGGRGSCKSSFVSLEIVDGIMKDPNANAIIFRKIAASMRESVFTQISWAIDTLGASALWRGSVSPMQYTYLPTGQQIHFRGLDDPAKLKSIKPRRGHFKYVWYEEFAELQGANIVRNTMQSVVRGDSDFRIFCSFNPPLSVNNWANKYITIPDDRAIVFKTDYTMIPREWLGESFILEAERLKDINEAAYRHEYLGEPTGTGGEVFPNIETRTITDDEILQMQYFYNGLDFGFSVDPACYMRVAYDKKRETVYLIDEIYKRHLSNKSLAEMIKEKGYSISQNAYRSPYTGEIFDQKQAVICDSAEPKSIADLQAEGIRALACRKFQGSVQYGIKWLQMRKIVIDPRRTPNAHREFTEYEYMQTKDGQFLADVPDANNHSIDAVRYALDRIINSAKNSA